jgi:hypothetical protein
MIGLGKPAGHFRRGVASAHSVVRRQDEETSAASVPRDPFLENPAGDVAHPEVGLSSSSV